MKVQAVREQISNVIDEVRAMNEQVNQEQILDVLPHGSGIDAKWQTSETRNYWCFHNSFHVMDEHGFYDGWADFTLKIPKVGDINDYTLQFNGNRSQYLARRNYLRDLLESDFSYALSQLTTDS